MITVTFEIPDEAALSVHVSAAQLPNELRLAAAVKLYEIGRLSSGAAARLAGVPRVTFLSRLAEYGVDTFRASDAELDADIANA